MEKNSTSSGTPEERIFVTGGAFIRTVSTVRDMKTYCVTENEMQSMTLLNSVTSFFASIGSAIILIAIGLKTDAIMEDVLTEQAELLSELGFWVCIVVALVCYAIAGVAWKSRRSMLQRILKETQLM